MKKAGIWISVVSILFLLVWNIFSDHVNGVKSEKQWYLSQLKFDCSGTLDSIENGRHALILIKHGEIDFNKEARLKDELCFNGLLDLFLYRQDGRIDLLISGEPMLMKGDSVSINTDLGTARFFREGRLIHEQPLLKALRGRPF